MRWMFVTLAALTVALSPDEDAYGEGADLPNRYFVQSNELKDGDALPKSATCDGDGLSPSLMWRPDRLVPAKSFVLIAEDMDSREGPYTHWLVFNIPSTVDRIPHGGWAVGVAGTNSAGARGYEPPCPPPRDGVHRYYFRVFALDVDKLRIPEGSGRGAVETAMQSHVIGRGELMGKYARR